MLDLPHLLALVPALPLLGAILGAVFGSIKELKPRAHVPVIFCAALSCACALVIVSKMATDSSPEMKPIEYPKMVDATDAIQWFVFDSSSAKFQVSFALTADHLSGVMLLAITFIGFWIVVFSVGYMRGSPGFARYFATVSLFLGSMCILVLADNFLLMFAGWEGVGLCSYLLVGFWHHKPAAAAAARKAFLVTRLGDIGLILGIFMFWMMHHQVWFSIESVLSRSQQMADDYPTMFAAACLLIVCGAVGKSAQIPLYVWLPDAMEGPTPVSALIHAATMVTAGVYLLARCAPLFVLVPGVQLTIAIIGAATALLAAFIALTQHDLKRVLAYSTVSQIGFMFLAVGCSGPALPVIAVSAGLFHLFTHAFFKGVLFLSAGSVMHSMHDTIDMREFSGLKRVLPITRWTFLCGALALAGVPIFSGFWSKDAVLESALEAGKSDRFGSIYLVLFGVALVTALMTAFYTFRAYFRTFEGELRMPTGSHPHEPWVMSLPLIVLAIGAVAVGFVAGPATHWFADFVSTTPSLAKISGGKSVSHTLDWSLMGGSAAVALIGVFGAWYLYVKKPAGGEVLANKLSGLYSWSQNKLYVDEIYNVLFVQPLSLLAGICGLFESVVSDVSRLVATLPRYLGIAIKPLQNGLVQFYALTMVVGVAAFIGYLILFAR